MHHGLLAPAADHARGAAGREHCGADARFTRFVQGIQAQFANVVVLDARHAGYARSSFADPMHLDRRAAVAFSADVAAVLKNDRCVPTGRRWLRMPKYHERPGLAAPEDMEQSAVAVKGLDTRRR